MTGPRPLLGLAACVLREPEIVAITRSAGLDWLLVDTEHAAFDLAAIARITLAARLAGLPCLVRATGPRQPDLARLLDIGAEGLVIPHVDSAAEARDIVARCRFAPIGGRSVPGPLAGFGFANPPVTAMMAAAEAETTLVAMIESANGLAEAAAIAATPGIDAVMVGANDLANDLGHPGLLDHPAVRDAFQAIAAATHAAGKVFGVIGLPPALLPSHAVALGARLVVGTNDINLLVDGARELAGKLKENFG
ncbi:HpcH/HpaI aldolase family protein [Roseomonas sp. USHLN139]|uniref:HpcH/HpaI aldolase family protein n=1 Tax=Roseomonas sp. USHLN139 TaxID=3081298 RepID=UPI003B02A7A2